MSCVCVHVHGCIRFLSFTRVGHVPSTGSWADRMRVELHAIVINSGQMFTEVNMCPVLGGMFLC